jgi:hypothetical protein
MVMDSKRSEVIEFSGIDERYPVVCRVHQDLVRLILPCNWVKRGQCGCDGKPCDIEILEDEP